MLAAIILFAIVLLFAALGLLLCDRAPEVGQEILPEAREATFGPWAEHYARCSCNICR